MQLAVMNNIHEALSILPASEIAKLLDNNPDLVSQEGMCLLFACDCMLYGQLYILACQGFG